MFLESFNAAGMIAWLMLLPTISGIPFGLLVLFLNKKLKLIKVYLAFSSTPILLGVYGLIDNYSNRHNISTEMPEYTNSTILAPIELGIILSAPLLILGTISFLIHKARDKNHGNNLDELRDA